MQLQLDIYLDHIYTVSTLVLYVIEQIDVRTSSHQILLVNSLFAAMAY